MAGAGIFLVRFAPRWISSDMGNFSLNQPRQLGWCMGFVIWGGLGGEEAVEVVGANRWLDGIFGKWGLIGGQNLVWGSIKTFETVHGKPFYTRAGIYPLAAR